MTVPVDSMSADHGAGKAPKHMSAPVRWALGYQYQLRMLMGRLGLVVAESKGRTICCVLLFVAVACE